MKSEPDRTRRLSVAEEAEPWSKSRSYQSVGAQHRRAHEWGAP
jgi:hypothetical protein